MDQKYLPIGSVCTIKGKNKKVMITGYYSIEFNGNIKVYDYKGCTYPEGSLMPDQEISFNHYDIENIDFMGYKNEDQEKFMALFNELTGNMSSDERDVADFHKQNDMILASSNSYSKLLFDENGVVMIADPIVPEESEETEEHKFIKDDKVANPFYKEHEKDTDNVEDSNDWSIFNKSGFDEEVGKAADSQPLSEIKFDENGVVISVGGQDMETKTDYSKYKFDEDGTLIAVLEEPEKDLSEELTIEE